MNWAKTFFWMTALTVILVLGGGLLFTVPSVAQANPHASSSHRVVRHDHPTFQPDTRPDWWDDPFVGVSYGPYVSPFVAPRLLFTGFDRVPDFYYAPPGIGAPSSGFYLPYLTNFFGDDYFRPGAGMSPREIAARRFAFWARSLTATETKIKRFSRENRRAHAVSIKESGVITIWISVTASAI